MESWLQKTCISSIAFVGWNHYNTKQVRSLWSFASRLHPHIQSIHLRMVWFQFRNKFHSLILIIRYSWITTAVISIHLPYFLYSVDCRICVWNASDGSLVHSLIGHKESVSIIMQSCITFSFCESYVLPFVCYFFSSNESSSFYFYHLMHFEEASFIA